MTQQPERDISVLVVDDDKDITEGLSQYLANNGYATAQALTGQQGLALIKQHQHHIALVDLKLPDINGIELLQSIKAHSPDTIIVLISGYATIDAAAKAIQHGAHDFIAKPFNFQELERTLRRAIEKRARTARRNKLKKRNLIIALTLPLWALLGYLLIKLIK